MSFLCRFGGALKRGWIGFWTRVAWVQAIIILVVVYAVPLGLTSLIAFLLRRDFLRRRVRGATTYWIDRPPPDRSIERAQRQF